MAFLANIGSGQEVCFCPSRPDPGRNAREQDGTRTGRDGPHLGTWMGPKHCKAKHMANLDGTTSDPGWDLDGPGIGPRRVSDNIQERKISPKRKFWGRMSRGHPGVIRADIPAQNFGQGARNPGKTSIWARTSMTRRRGRPRP